MIYSPEPWTEWRATERHAFSYLLGMYLGDGSIAVTKKGHAFIRFSCDAAYPGIAFGCAMAIARCTPARVGWQRHPRARLIVLQASGKLWLELFPQHGPGRKHERPIELAPWQREITRRYPRELVRGLIHSDGCRCINRFGVKLPSGRVGRYEYARYFFTNMSADIRRIFCEHCDLLGVRWSQSNHQTISVANRPSVAILDSFIGPKA